MVIVGLTGSVGMGKSTTAAMFAEAGVPVFDADAAVHALYKGRAAPAVEAAFPGVVKDGVVDRTELGARVLDDLAALKRLEAIVHPMVQEERAAFLGKARMQGAPLIVFDIPLLFEVGIDLDVDAVVVVSAPAEAQRARVLARPGMTEVRFAAILAKQMPDEEKRKRARFVIETGEGLELARAQVREVIAELT